MILVTWVAALNAMITLVNYDQATIVQDIDTPGIPKLIGSRPRNPVTGSLYDRVKYTR